MADAAWTTMISAKLWNGRTDILPKSWKARARIMEDHLWIDTDEEWRLKCKRCVSSMVDILHKFFATLQLILLCMIEVGEYVENFGTSFTIR